MAARPRVLVDSGVNEEIRPRPEGFALNKCRRSQLALASGATFHAWRTRDGELMIGDEEMDQSADWIVSVRRLRGIRGAFVWDEVGPKVMYIDGDTTVTVHCFEQNRLPYIWWEYFKPIKVLLARDWKSNGNARVVKIEDRGLFGFLITCRLLRQSGCKGSGGVRSSFDKIRSTVTKQRPCLCGHSGCSFMKECWE